MNRRLPAIVLNCEAHGGLGIVRSLGRLGVTVFAVHRDRFAPAKFSRYAARGYRWDFATASINIFTDIVILVLPLRAFARLNLHRRKRCKFFQCFV